MFTNCTYIQASLVQTFRGPIWLLVSLSGVPNIYGLVGTGMLSLHLGGIAFEGLRVSFRPNVLPG